MEISFIVPAKKLDIYLFDHIKVLLKYDGNFEVLIIVDNLSPTYLKKKIFSKIRGTKVKIFKNKRKGRISALNYGYSKCKGKIIKCIDSDDRLMVSFFNHVKELKKYDAHCHNAIISNNNLNKLVTYIFNPFILKKNYKYLVENMISSPRWSWSFQRKIAKKIFPIPENLFAEDFWFTFLIKKHSKKIKYINEELYIYRQHLDNEWGGVMNFEEKVVKQRSKWLINEINQLKVHKNILKVNENDFKKAEIYHDALLKKSGFFEILTLNIDFIFKIKLLIILYFPRIATTVIKLKWFFDKYR